MERRVLLYKPIGVTPLELIEKFRKENPQYKDIKIAYAGRLDPMAHGQMLLLIGDECKYRDKYQDLDKEYRFKVLLGVTTDTFDILGIVKSQDKDNKGRDDKESSKSKKLLEQVTEETINSKLLEFRGKIEQSYPIYSSKTVKGKPLYWWARNNRLNEIEIPKKIIEIYSIELIYLSTIIADELKQYILEMINRVKGDFRQEEIINSWNNFFKGTAVKEFPIIELKAKVSSGTYIRSIANDLGSKLQREGIALEIERTNIFFSNLELH